MLKFTTEFQIQIATESFDLMYNVDFINGFQYKLKNFEFKVLSKCGV